MNELVLRWKGSVAGFLARSSFSPRALRTLAKTHLPKSANYFSYNQNKINKILQQLADDLSKQTFSELILCRTDRTLPTICEKTTQYFPPGILQLGPKETFVDCGAFTGDSLINFQQFCHHQYDQIVAFEPEPTLFAKLKQNNFSSCTYINGGVWHQNKQLPFLALGSAGSRLEMADTSGDCPPSKLIQVPVYKIDDIAACRNVTFLKMDVEGAELNALKGAEKTIRKNKPKLAVCIYHSDRDMLEIPCWILSLNLGYKLYVRHYSNDLWETVLYAV